MYGVKFPHAWFEFPSVWGVKALNPIELLREDPSFEEIIGFSNLN